MSSTSSYVQEQGFDQVLRQRGGHEYSTTSVAGHARVQQGDTIIVQNYYNNNQSDDDSEKRIFKTLADSLTFDQLNARFRNIAHSFPTTSQWLFTHNSFAEWLDIRRAPIHQAFLWLKGKPGSGKSTIMKELISWFAKKHPQEVRLSYFFNARSAEILEKSSLGMYRSLVHQLLSNPSCKAIHTFFISEFTSKLRNGKVDEWQENELKNFILALVSQTRLPPVNIFIDALDEGDQDDVRQMVQYLEDVAQVAASDRVPLRICLSSRHYPNITVENSITIIVEDEAAHENDIKLYVESKLRGDRSAPFLALRTELVRKSSHVFLWVVLVVPMLNQAYDRGKGLAALFAKLNSIPPSLHELFINILSKVEKMMMNASLPYSGYFTLSDP